MWSVLVLVKHEKKNNNKCKIQKNLKKKLTTIKIVIENRHNQAINPVALFKSYVLIGTVVLASERRKVCPSIQRHVSYHTAAWPCLHVIIVTWYNAKWFERRWKTSVFNCRKHQRVDIPSGLSLMLCKIKLCLKCNRRNRNLEIRGETSALSNPDVRKHKHHLTIGLNKTADEDNTAIDWMVICLNEATKDFATATSPKKRKANRVWITERTLEKATEKRRMKSRRQ